jgi:hypothetical protein
VRFPRTPAASKASEISRQTSQDRRRIRRPTTKKSAIQEIMMKNVLLFLNEPKAAPVLVMFTKRKKFFNPKRSFAKGGGPSGLTYRITRYLVSRSSPYSGSERKKRYFTKMAILPAALSGGAASIHYDIFAAIAQIWMRLACADVRPVTPTACAFWKRCFCN